MPMEATKLFVASSLDDAWTGLLRDWFAEAQSVWREDLPSLVVVPTRALANNLKARLLRDGRSHLGLRLVTPPLLRELLRGQAAIPRAHLRLLLAAAATEIATSAEPNSSVAFAAKAVARTPEHLLQALDRLTSAGWDFAELSLEAFGPIVQRFREQLAACDFHFNSEIDRALAKQEDIRFSKVLALGFDSSHWPLWFLLRAAVNATRSATVIVDLGQGDASDAAQLWQGSWEEAFGEARPIQPGSRTPNGSLFTDAQMRGETQRVGFLVGADATEQASAIAQTCIRFLADDNDARIGIVIAQTDALPRLISTALSRLGLPHYDGIAHYTPGLFESGEWRAWLEWQRSPRSEAFLQFVRALPNAAEIFPDVSVSKMESVLREAHAQVLIDDVDVLREFCAGKNPPVAGSIASLGRLPAQATLAEFLRATKTACEQLSWRQQWLEIANRLGDWIDKLPVEIPRAHFLRWLEEIATSFGVERSEPGGHPYARVQLATVASACGQEWSHLIFAGWNDGAWPPPARGEFAREEEIAAFNRNVRELNRRATRQGRQGEGHVSIRDGHTYYLGPREQRAIALRQFEALRESAAKEVVLSASLVKEGEPERFWNPSELFTQLYQDAEKRPLTQKAMRDLQAATGEWLQNSNRLTSSKKSAPAIGQTRAAYEQRRDPQAKSNEYDFAFRSAPNQTPVFSVSEFDRFISAPALVWMRHYLGVRAVVDDAYLWNSSSGQWIHDWLAQAAGGAEKSFSPLPSAAEIDRKILAAANAKRAQIEEWCAHAKRTLPDWWRSGWEHALFLARALGERLASTEGWPWISSEWKIDDDLPAKIDNRTSLAFRGRIDAILSRSHTAAGSLAAEELWIIDYKTGSKRALRPPAKKKMLDGSALQLGLYAIAARTRGAQQTSISLLSPLVRPIQPQLSDKEIFAETEILRELARMQQSGVFGMHGSLRSAFRFTEDYPLATLGIDQDTVEQRWENTHPALVREEEEFFW